ncbi:MAG TPA: SprT family zinc-dependent metalloprotease [Opitutaceae bacterium]|nr:SprT family zinc-dependent metalloprotease [Opitutaceae bacterium]
MVWGVLLQSTFEMKADDPFVAGGSGAARRAPSVTDPPTAVMTPGGATGPEVRFIRSERARNYRLTLRRDGTAVATIPRRGSEREARRFVARQRGWLERAWARQQARPRAPARWTTGTVVLWRGEPRTIGVAAGGARPMVGLGADVFRVAQLDGDLRPALEAQFAHRARIELPARTWELAAATGVEIRHVTIRNQRSRWGSCSAGGTISLNWRLVQAPEPVRDYLIYHELMHLREMNHSRRFWARVAAVCPDWRAAERWLEQHAGLLGL